MPFSSRRQYGDGVPKMTATLWWNFVLKITNATLKVLQESVT